MSEPHYTGTDPGFFRVYKPWLQGCNRVLDFGCGVGNFLAWASENGIDAEGYDPVSAAYQTAQERGFIVHNTEPDLSGYDGLVMICLIEHLQPDKLASILERFSGTLIIQSDEPRYREPWYLFKHRSSFWDDPEHVRPYSPKGLANLLTYHGYNILIQGRARSTKPRLWQIRSQLVRFRLWRLDKLYGIQSPHYAVAKKSA